MAYGTTSWPKLGGWLQEHALGHWSLVGEACWFASRIIKNIFLARGMDVALEFVLKVGHEIVYTEKSDRFKQAHALGFLLWAYVARGNPASFCEQRGCL